jgi:glycosyltransferase involved in cell wall biosynthesis
VSPREAAISGRLNSSTPAAVVLNPSPFTRATAPRGHVSPRSVITVGRISPQKDPALFAAVASQFDPADVSFHWIGDGDPADREALEAAGVDVSGWVAPAQLRGHLEQAALYLHTAAWEGGPVSTIEAASLGVPVLAKAIPSMRSLGYELAGESADELVAHVQRFFGDDEYAAEVGAVSTALATEASKPAMAAALRSAYTSAMTRASRGRPSAR